MGTIVLADDDDDTREVFGPWLRSVGHQVWDAVDGRQALDLIAQHRPDLLILDIWMPGCNGFEVLEQLRHDPTAALMPILMLSNRSDADTRLECFELGATDYVVKGLPFPELRGRVDRLLASSVTVADSEPIILAPSRPATPSA